MAVTTWLLLSLLSVHTVTGGGLRHRDVRDDDLLESLLEGWEPKRLARGGLRHRDVRDDDLLESLLEGWTPKRLARHNIFQSQLQDGELSKVRRTLDTCGVPAIAPSVNVRVVGGVEAVPHSWPWMVSLQNNGHHFCGGSLINSQWVVSAAHCGGRVGTEIEAVLGLHRRSQPDSFTVRVPVSRVILNKKYNNPMSPSATRGTSDIMLLKLAYPVEFNDAVSPVCLLSLFQVLPDGKACYTSGWGQLSTEGGSPDQLMQALLPVIDRETCNQPTWHNYTVDDSMICAGYEEGRLGNCYGDSGGPLVCREADRWMLYGIVSWGSLRGCAAESGPTVYARASAYVNWISEVISENSK